ncbi:MAG: coproporphyrinogen-III oxidase family protein [Spirochaetes bacterium]|jgi:oxygen-independent coproporphyrinogen-3 oxidase|nr:coproporphyrinogen-III oxidase family protein [Spirochaetota bacterium]
MLRIILLLILVLAGVNEYGIYLHIPFCIEKCSYCSFYSVAGTSSDFKNRYTRFMCLEIEKDSLCEPDGLCTSIYFGGGTPSLLSDNNIAMLLQSLRNRFCISQDCEITLECNPAQFDYNRFLKLCDQGITRFSMGVQAMDFQLFKYLGRTGSPVTLKLLGDYFSLPALCGIDFITGIIEGDSTIPDIQMVLPLRPDHISAYLLTLEPGTALYNRARRDGLDQFQHEEYLKVASVISEHGYTHYEISNFALSGALSRHNLKYWTGKNYRGFGANAHSFIDGERYFHEADIESYMQGNAVPCREERKSGDLLVEIVFTGLRTVFGVSEEDYFRLSGLRFPKILCDRAASTSGICLTEREGWMNLAMNSESFVDYDIIVYELLEPFL